MSETTLPPLPEKWACDDVAIAAFGAHHGYADAPTAAVEWMRLDPEERVNWRAAVDAMRMLDAIGKPQPAPAVSGTTPGHDLDRLADLVHEAMDGVRNCRARGDCDSCTARYSAVLEAAENYARIVHVGAAGGPAEPQPAPAPPLEVPPDGAGVMRPADGETLIIAFAPGVPVERVTEMALQLRHESGLKVIAVADVAAVKGWQPDAENDDLRERLGRLQDSIGNIAAGMKLSASASRPSKQSEIEDGCADALLALLDPR